MKEKPKIIVIVGPTASGKSALAVRLAKIFNGEIVSADSRQVYRGMDIGTGKVTRDEMDGVRHHLLDVTSPKRVYTVADYRDDATIALRGILRRKKLPIICGGTGFYISALVDGLVLPDVKPDHALRARLRGKSVEELFERLKKLDPAFAEKVDQKNPRRLIRAIEIARALGRVPALRHESPYEPLFIGISISTNDLAQKIHRRLVDRMALGMLDEVRALGKRGVSSERMEELGLEYRYLRRHIDGLLSREEMHAQLERAIRQYAKRQMTWFARDKRIRWIPVKGGGRMAERAVRKFLGKSRAHNRSPRFI